MLLVWQVGGKVRGILGMVHVGQAVARVTITTFRSYLRKS